jgi:hypothetical protein
MKFITTLILIFTLVSCKQKSKNDYENKIIGEWKFVREIIKPNENGKLPPPPPFGNSEVGYEFYKNGEFEYKLGFFKYIKGDEKHQSQNLYLGTKSKFKIEDDSLKLYDIAEKIWNSYKIVDIKSDTLKIINSVGEISKFQKLKHKINNSDTFDKVIVSSTGCYGRCPVTDIEINKNGEIIYNGGSFSSIKGNYKSKINHSQFLKINLSFLKSNWANLENEYIARWTDDETVYVTFIKDDRIIKTIEDYGAKSPTEFIWAYTPIRFLQQSIKLEKNIKETNILDFNYISFKFENKICDLTKSESFYLKNLLSKSSEVKNSFEEKYIIKYWSNDIKKKIVTDGRYYKFENNDGRFVILDLKYDFLKKNNLLQTFRNITEYD